MPATTIDGKTVKDWLATPEEQHWELIHGDLIMTEESYGNVRLAGEIQGEIRDYLKKNPLGIVERHLAFIFPGIHSGEKHGPCPISAFSRTRNSRK